ncbi:MAG: hypothetical protein FWD61_16420 [Phycisphaerales bacterium]|nr:hypothetical protein [Phycisphaerales bacterium]
MMLRFPSLAIVVIFVVVRVSVASVEPPSALSLHPARTASVPISLQQYHALALTLGASPAHVTDRFLVGGKGEGAAEYSAYTDVTPHVPGYLHDEADSIRDRVSSPGFFDRLANLFEVDEVERAWDTTTTVHFLVAEPAVGQFTPFATVAHQVDVNDIAERMGIGCGLLYKLSKNISVASEAVYLGSDRTLGNSGFNSEAIFMARLQIEY